MKHTWKKFLSAFLAVVLVLSLAPVSVFAATAGDFTITLTNGDGDPVLNTDYKYENNTLTILTGTELTISGTTTTDKIVVPSGVTANITLHGLSIDVGGTGSACAFEVLGTANITLSGENSLKSGQDRAGLEVPAGAALLIKEESTGRLTVQGGHWGAGIGTRSSYPYDSNTGNITISGGTVVATGGSAGAGIGGGRESSGGNITITGGTVTANGGYNSAGIGGGGVVSGGRDGGNGGNVTISGGTVMANGDKDGAGIGAGGGGNTQKGSFSTTDTGNAFIVTSSISANENRATQWRGVIFGGEDDKNIGMVYGTSCELTTDVEVPAGKTLSVGTGQTLSLAAGVTLSNNGTIKWAQGASIPENIGGTTEKYPYYIYGDLLIEADESAGTGLSYADGVLTINTTVPVKILTDVNTTATRIVVAASGANITLENVTIAPLGVPVTVQENISATLTLIGENVLQGVHGQGARAEGEKAKGKSGIQINSGASLSITGEGSLSVAGGNGGNAGTWQPSYNHNDWITGGDGGVGVQNDGTLTISAKQVSITGGNGGNSDCNGGGWGLPGGSGGAAIAGSSGSVVISQGQVSVTGGKAGTSGRSNGAVEGRAGADGIIAQSVTVTGGTVAVQGGAGAASVNNGTGGKGGNGISAAATITGGHVTTKGGAGGNGNPAGENGAGFVEPLSTGDGGNAVIFTDNLPVEQTTDSLSGVIFQGTEGQVYGSPQVTEDFEIPSGFTLTIPETSTLEIQGTIINRGTIVNNGTITGNGTIDLSEGSMSGNAPSSETTLLYMVASTLPQIISFSGADRATNQADYTATLTAAEGYSLPASITVTVGDNTLTAGTDYTYDQTSGGLTIPKEKTTGNITIQAVLTFTVTFDVNNTHGTAPSAQTVEYGKKVTDPNLSISGYNLDGWYNGESKWNFGSDTVTTNITLTARWTEYTASGITVTGGANHVDYYYDTVGNVHIVTNTSLNLTSSGEVDDNIIVDSGVTANLTLAGVNTSGYLKVSDAGNSNITLQEETTNNLSYITGPGSGKTLTIGGAGTLDISDNYYAISGEGNFTISGGTISANSIKSESGTVTISGGTVTVATKIGGTFSTGSGGSAFIVASMIEDNDDKTGWSGVIFEGNSGAVYGTQSLSTNAEIPAGGTLTIDSRNSLTIAEGVTLKNGGTIVVDGNLFNNGTILGGTIDAATGSVTNNGTMPLYLTPQPTAAAPQINLSEPDANVSVKWQMQMPKSYTVTSSGDSAWQDIGNDVYQSQNHADNSSSTLTLSYTVGENGKLELRYKVSSESSYDKLSVIVKNSGGTEVGSAINKSGKVDWTGLSLTGLIPGTYTVTATYSKDSSQSSGDDCAWLQIPDIWEDMPDAEGLILPVAAAKAAGTKPVRGVVTHSGGTVTSRPFQPAEIVTLTYDYQGADGGNTQTEKLYYINTSAGELPAPSKTGYLFQGWFTAASGGNEVTAETVITGDITIYAQWTEATYTLNVTAPTFDTVTYGYSQPDAKAITIKNTGNSDATITSVALFGAGASAFTLNKTDGTTISTGATDSTTYTVQPNAGLDAGTYTATITVTYNGGATATATLEWKIDKATPNADLFDFAAPQNLVYDGNAKTATVQTKSGVTGMGSITVKHYNAQGNEVTPVDVGTYTVKINVAEGSNYTAKTDITDTDWTFAITKSGSEVTPDTSSVTTIDYGGTLVLKVNVAAVSTFAVSTPAINTVDFYCGETKLGTANVNYTSGVFGSATLDYDTKLGGVPAGTHEVKAYFGGSENLDPDLEIEAISVTVNQKTVGLSWSDLDAEALVYDGQANILTATVTGALDGDFLGVTVQPDGDNINVGSFTYQAIGLTGDKAGFYKLPSDVNSQIETITAIPVTITPDAGLTKVYGTDDPALTFTYTGHVDGESPNFTGKLAHAGVDVGMYDITIGTLKLADSDSFLARNYTLNFVDGVKFTITQATYDMSDVAFTDVSYTFDGEEKELLITGTLPIGVQVSYTNNKLTNVGSVTATATFTGDAVNYKPIPDKTATLTITNATFSVTAKGYDGVYDGQPHSISVTADGAQITYSTDGENYGAECPTFTNAGTYTVYYKATKANHHDVTGSLTVNIAKDTPKLAITADRSALYGGGRVELTVTGAPAEGTYEITCAPAIAANADGSYTLPNKTEVYTFTVSYTESSNYTAATATCTVSVTKHTYIPPMPNYYTLTFDTNGGTTISSISRVFGTTIDLTGYTTTREGFTFTGWYADEWLTEEVTSVKLRKDTTVYAGWEKIEEPVVNPFKDVFESDWYYDDVIYVYEKDLMQGTATDMFSPAVTTTRGMIVTILYRLEGEPSTYGLDNPFTDLTQDWYVDAVKWAAANGIVEGYGNGKYGPEDPITREQMATILWRYAKYMGIDVSSGNGMNIEGFADDEQISNYAVEAMKWVIAEGIIGGRPGGVLDPTGNAQRCEVAAIIHRFCELIEK